MLTKIKNSILFPIFLGILGLTVVLVATGIIIARQEKNKPHQYINTVVSEKYILDGFAGWYFWKDTEFKIVSHYNDGLEDRYVTTTVDEAIYNSLQIGDVVIYCTSHNKLEIYE